MELDGDESAEVFSFFHGISSLFDLEASILESKQESDDQDHQGRMDNAGRTTNPNNPGKTKTPPAACRDFGRLQTASGNPFSFLAVRKSLSPCSCGNGLLASFFV